MTNKQIFPADLRKMTKGEYILLDTLPGDHFRKIHIPDAHNACVYEVSFLDQVQELVLDKNKQLIVYGSSNRSYDAEVAAEKLQRAGYPNVAVLAGGLEAWRECDFSPTGEAIDAPDDPETFITLAGGMYQLDLSKSIAEWAGRNQNSKHFGTIRFSKGSLAVTNGLIKGELEIDMESIENINLKGDDLQPVLISHLTSDDFFFVSNFPKASYKITQGRLTEKAYATAVNCLIQGELTLRGVTADLGFEATLSHPGEKIMGLEAHFDLDRTRWGINYGSVRYFEHLGMHTVFDAISIELRCFFTRQ
ncbi:MAG: YceI family protein [Desulforhopalus sp.]